MPASISKAVTTGLLREQLGFRGLIFTDAMTMQGVAAHYSPEEATLRAVKAGADFTLIPVDVEKSFRTIKRAVEAGEIPLSRIEASVRRILEAKAGLGLHQNRFVNVNQLDTIVGSPEHGRLVQTRIERALTLVRDEKGVLPLKLEEDQRVLHSISLTRGRIGGWVCRSACRARIPSVTVFRRKADRNGVHRGEAQPA